MHTQQELTEIYVQEAVETEEFKPLAPGQTLDDDYGGTSSLIALSVAVDSAQAESRTWRLPIPAVQFPADPALAYKRIFDVLGGALILLAVSPVFILWAAAVLISSPGPVFFKHRRVGRGGEEFFVWKFRTMCQNPDQVLAQHLNQNPGARAEWLETQKLTNDPRVFRGGRFMRRFSLDELPQLWNVLKGEMSLIGPRPIVLAEVDRYGEAIWAYYRVRPGMTGLWQVSGRSATTYAKRIQLDKQYVEDWSLKLDAEILLRTVRVVLTAEGAY